MKSILFLLLVFLSFNARAQYFWREDFEAPNDVNRSHFTIDTVNYHHNLWQIGRPRKTVFDSNSASSPDNVIVTDTVHPVLANDTSVFTVAHYFIHYGGFFLNFNYRLDIDSNSNVKVEVSGDRGLSWINPLTQDTTYLFYWGGPKPRLDTSTSGWQNFELNMGIWGQAVSGGSYSFPHYRISDTVLFRFTYVTGNDTAHKDGWMMDDFYVQNGPMEGLVNQILINDNVSIFPVPSNGFLYYSSTESDVKSADITIFDMKGSEVFNAPNMPASGFVSLPLPAGNYLLKYNTGKSYALKQLVITR